MLKKLLKLAYVCVACAAVYAGAIFLDLTNPDYVYSIASAVSRQSTADYYVQNLGAGDKKTFLLDVYGDMLDLNTGTQAQDWALSEDLHELQKSVMNDETTYGIAESYWYSQWQTSQAQADWDKYVDAGNKKAWIDDPGLGYDKPYAAAGSGDAGDVFWDGDHVPFIDDGHVCPWCNNTSNFAPTEPWDTNWLRLECKHPDHGTGETLYFRDGSESPATYQKQAP